MKAFETGRKGDAAIDWASLAESMDSADSRLTDVNLSRGHEIASAAWPPAAELFLAPELKAVKG